MTESIALFKANPFLPPVDSRQGDALKRIRNLSNPTTPEVRDAFLDALHSPVYYTDILLNFNVIDDPLHFDVHWFPRGWEPNPNHDPEITKHNQKILDKHPNIYWPNLQPIVELIRERTTQAFEMAKEKNVFVEPYWVVPEGFTCVEVLLIPTEQQITLLRFTPPPPAVDNRPPTG